MLLLLLSWSRCAGGGGGLLLRSCGSRVGRQPAALACPRVAYHPVASFFLSPPSSFSLLSLYPSLSSLSLSLSLSLSFSDLLGPFRLGFNSSPACVPVCCRLSAFCKATSHSVCSAAVKSAGPGRDLGEERRLRATAANQLPTVCLSRLSTGRTH